MSVIGISPSDIVNGVAVVNKAFNALRSGDDGAQRHYQDTKRTLAQRTRALEELLACTAGFLPEPRGPAEILLEKDVAFQRKISSYENSLGRGAREGKRHGLKGKMKLAFKGEKDIRNHVDSSQPAVDAAIFQGLR